MQASVKPSRHSLRAPFSSISAFENMTVFKNMIAMLEQIAPQHADKTAFAFLRNGETPQGQLTYSQLQQNAQRIAAYLQQYAQQGDRIVLMLSPGLDYISSFFACLYAGCVAVPAYPPANRRRDGAKLDALLADANPSVILTSAKEHQRLADTLAQSQWQQKILSLDEAKHIKQQQYQPPNDINLNTLAFLQYTSGSTGNPKGVMVSHGNLLANLAAINKALKTDANTKCATWLPPYHDMGLIGTLLSCVFVGGTAYIMEPVAFNQR